MLDLTTAPSGRSAKEITKDGFTLTTTSPPHIHYDHCSLIVHSNSAYYHLSHMFDNSINYDPTQYYLANSGQATVTVSLNQTFFINNIRVYPTKGFPSKFKVSINGHLPILAVHVFYFNHIIQKKIL